MPRPANSAQDFEDATRVAELGFQRFDSQTPFDLEAHLARVPKQAMVKGMFYADLVRVCEGVGASPPEGRYSSFGDYALVDYMRHVARVAAIAHPGKPPSDAIRLLGRRAFGVLSSSLAGRVLFAFAGRDLAAALGLVSDAYKRCLSPATASVSLLRAGLAVIELRDVWNFTDSFQVGVFEGAIDHYGHTGSVRVKPLSACAADYLLEWR